MYSKETYTKRKRERQINKKDKFDFFQRKKEAILNFEFSKKAKGKNAIKFLIQAINLDNTNSDIVFSYLQFLQKENPSEFEKQLQVRKVFLTSNQIHFFSSKDPRGNNSPKEIFHLIIETIVSDGYQNWVQNFVSAIEKYDLVNPFILDLMKKNEHGYSFEALGKKYSYIDDIRPNFPFSLVKEDHYYNYLFLTLSATKDEFINRGELAFKAFEILSLVFKHNKDINLIEFLDIVPNSKRRKLSSYLLNIRNKIQVNEALKNDKNAVIELNSFFNDEVIKIKPNLFEFLRQIVGSNCIKSLLKLSLHDYNKSEINLINTDFLDLAEENTTFNGKYNNKKYGKFNSMTLYISINSVQRELNSDDFSDSIEIIFHCGVWLITLIHEIFGHFSRRYLFYYTNRKGSTFTPRETINMDCGKYIENLLFSDCRQLNFSQIEYIFNTNNWDLDYNSFQKGFLDLSYKEGKDNNKTKGQKTKKKECHTKCNTYFEKLCKKVNCSQQEKKDAKDNGLEIHFCLEEEEREELCIFYDFNPERKENNYYVEME